MKKHRRLVIALAFLAAAAGGCATSLATNDTPSSEGAASPTTGSPTSPPANVFFPETPHDFGSEGQ